MHSASSLTLYTFVILSVFLLSSAFSPKFYSTSFSTIFIFRPSALPFFKYSISFVPWGFNRLLAYIYFVSLRPRYFTVWLSSIQYLFYQSLASVHLVTFYINCLILSSAFGRGISANILSQYIHNSPFGLGVYTGCYLLILSLPRSLAVIHRYMFL